MIRPELRHLKSMRLDSPWNTSRLVHVVQWALGHHTKTFPEPINFKISSKCFQIIILFSQYCYLALHLVSPLNIESIMESIRSSFISKGSSPISFSLLFSSTPDLLDLLPLGSIGTSRRKGLIISLWVLTKFFLWYYGDPFCIVELSD